MSTQPIPTQPAPEYRDDSRFERIDGRWVERSVPTKKHAKVQGNLFLLLRQQVKPLGGQALPEWSVAQPETAERSDRNYMTPDVVAVLPPIQEAPNGYLLPPALLVVEVVLPEQSGLITKAQRYHDWGIEHVWIVDPNTRECIEYHGGNQFTIARDELHAGDLKVRIADIFAELE
ncbi:MAG: Uma2 family endonuclease [Bryobacteraceae bacterium]